MKMIRCCFLLLVMGVFCMACTAPERVVLTEPDETEVFIAQTQAEMAEETTEHIDEEVTESVSDEPQFFVEDPAEESFGEDISETYEVEMFKARLCANKTVNIRKGPATSYDKVGVLEKGVSVEVIGKVSEGWYQIRYDGEIAFVSQNYLVDETLYQQQEQALSATRDISSEEENLSSEIDLAKIRSQVIALMNEQRTLEGISHILQSDELNCAAQIRAEEILLQFSHTRPNGLSCFTVLEENEVPYSNAGENIAMGYVSASDVMDGWMSSEGHRANILNPTFGQVGIGVLADKGGNGFYWVQIFTN